MCSRIGCLLSLDRIYPLFLPRNLAHPRVIIFEIYARKSVEFFGLSRIVLHNPRFCEIIIVLGIVWIETHGALEYADGVVGLSLRQKRFPLLRQLKRGPCARVGRFLGALSPAPRPISGRKRRPHAYGYVSASVQTGYGEKYDE